MVLHQIIISNLFFATMVIFSSNSLYSIFIQIILITGSIIILFSLKIEFLSFILLLIYIVALIILFMIDFFTYLHTEEESTELIHFTFSIDLVFYLILWFNFFNLLNFLNGSEFYLYTT